MSHILFQLKQKILPFSIILVLFLAAQPSQGLLQLENYTVKISDGSSLNLLDLKGNMTLLDTMTSICESCELQNHHLKQLYAAAPNLTIISISVDPEIDDVSTMNAYKQKFSLPWYVGVDEAGNLQFTYQITNYPNLFLFDTNGNLVERWNSVTEAKVIATVLSDYIPVAVIEDNNLSILLNNLISNPFFIVILAAIAIFTVAMIVKKIRS